MAALQILPSTLSPSLLGLPEEIRLMIYYYVFRTPRWEEHMEKCDMKQGRNRDRRKCCLMCFTMGDERHSCFLQPCVIELENNYFTFQRQIFWYDQTSHAFQEGRLHRASLPRVCSALHSEATKFIYQHSPIFINIRRDTRVCPHCEAIMGWHTTLEPKRHNFFHDIQLRTSMMKVWVTFDMRHDRNPGRIGSVMRDLEMLADGISEHPDPSFLDVSSCMVCGRGWVDGVVDYTKYRGQMRYSFKHDDVYRRETFVRALDELAGAVRF